jgi:uncharacterized protein YbcV (DUF1398 family)
VFTIEQIDGLHDRLGRGLADSGVQKWTVDTHAMTMTFYDRTGVALLVEKIT